MLHLLSSIWSSVTETEETKILFLGTSNSGKSALYERFKIFLQEGPDVPESEQEAQKDDSSKNNTTTSNGLGGGLASLKAELEKRKLLEEEERKKNEVKNNNINNDDNFDESKWESSSVDDVDVTTTNENEEAGNNNVKSSTTKKKFHRYYKPPKSGVAPLPRFMSPTVGLNVSKGDVAIPHSGQKISALLWDVGGDPSIRQLWYTYIVQCHGVVYTIDLSADAREQAQSVRLLHMLMQRPELAFAPFLIVGTKVDEMLEKEKQKAKKQQQQQSSINNNKQPSRRRPPIQQTLTQFSRLLHFEQLPPVPTFLSDTDLQNVSNHAHLLLDHHEKQNENGNDDDEEVEEEEILMKDDKQEEAVSKTAQAQNKKAKHHERFIPIDVDSLLAADAVDAVNAVPSGSVSGICGHMYHTAIANSKSLKNGTDLKQAMYWILSAAKSSRARSATLESWEEKLSAAK